MPYLHIQQFSCLDEAELQLSSMTVLIGPQASGKSVVSKLIYFFYDLVSSAPTSAEDGYTLDEFIQRSDTLFKEWFPVSAWGNGRFSIDFKAGPIEFSIRRKRAHKTPSEKISIDISDYFAAHYGRLYDSYRVAESTLPPDETDSTLFARRWEMTRKIEDESRRELARDLGSDYFEYQLFVPAGRSFFTSIGRAVAAFEQGGILDPLTIRFGRRFAAQRERARGRSMGPSNRDHVGRALRQRLMVELFGGQIRLDKEKDYVEATDGRRVPFSVLSSGQQELLPLWMSLESFSLSDEPRRALNVPYMIYIEEPEAHLFPSAQSVLIEYLSTLVASPQFNRRMLITTHSPYVLSKINNLVVAGLVGDSASRAVQSKISEIVPKSSWLTPGSVRAYAIIDRKLVNIIDEDGLVDGEYLDGVSSSISHDFLSLLDVESERT